MPLSDPALVAGFMVVLGVLKCCVAYKLANWASRKTRLSALRRIKFRISVWKFLYFATLMVGGFCVVGREDWIFDYRRYPHTYKTVPTAFRLYYFISIAFYINELIGIFIEPRKKDFREMLIHHVATITLIWLSYANGLVRYGITILLIHDISDPYLELAKINVALRNTRAANALFFVFMVVFIGTRIFVYPPFLVLPATCHLLGLKAQFWSLTIAVMLNVLVVAHIIWSYLILKMFHRIVYEHNTRDVRSEEKGF